MIPMKRVFALLVLFAVMTQAAGAETLTGYMLTPLDTLDTQKVYFNDIKNLSYDASLDNNAIMLVHFKVPAGATATYSVYCYGGTLVGSATTYFNATLIPPTTTTSSITFDGITKQYNYLDTNPEFDYFLGGYAKNVSSSESGVIIYNAGYGSFDNNLGIFRPFGSVEDSLIYRFDITCDEATDIDITYAQTDAVSAAANKDWTEIAGEWVEFAISVATFLLAFLTTLLHWLKFLFIDNIVMVVALYLCVSMAYCACTSSSIFVFYRRFFKFQRSMFEFLIGLWHVFIDIIASFRGIFRI